MVETTVNDDDEIPFYTTTLLPSYLSLRSQSPVAMSFFFKVLTGAVIGGSYVSSLSFSPLLLY